MSIQGVLDWIDEASNGGVRLVYLLAFVTATAIYFGAGTLPPQIEGPINAVLPWLVAAAIETQSYNSVRKLAKVHHTLQSPVLEDYAKEVAKKEFRTQLIVLTCMLLFGIWNQFNYLSSTWKPLDIPGLPVEVNILIRALALPLFFAVSAFSAPQPATVGEAIVAESHYALQELLKVMRQQRRDALDTLLGERGFWAGIKRKLGLPVREAKIVNMSDAIERLSVAAGERKAGTVIASVQQAIVELAAGPVEGTTNITALPAPRQGVQSGPRNFDAERECRERWRVGMKDVELAKLAHCSQRTARRWINRFQREMRQPQLVKQA